MKHILWRVCVALAFVLAAISGFAVGFVRADNLDDIRCGREAGLPTISLWPDGFDLGYQLGEIKKGHRLWPVVRMPYPADGNYWALYVNGGPAGVALAEAQLAELGKLNLPMTLRSANLSDSFGTQTQVYPGIFAGHRIRGLLQEGPPGTFTLLGTQTAALNAHIYAHSPLIFKESAPGALFDQDRPADAFANPGIWRLEGARWANGVWMRRVQDLVPNPTWIDFLDNNEVATDYFQGYHVNGVLKSVADIRKVSVRAAEYVAANPGITATQLKDEIARRRTILYRSALTGFKGTLCDSWREVPISTLGYTSGPDAANPQSMNTTDLYDVPSFGNTYVSYIGSNKKRLPSLTNPGWTQILNGLPPLQASNSKWRDLSIAITDGGAINGAQLGQTEVITPERFAGFFEWVLWTLRDQGKSVSLRYYQDNSTKPTGKFFSSVTAPIATQYGFDSAADVTNADYLNALIASIDRIYENETLMSFYVHGEPVVAPGVNPTDSYIKVLKLQPFPPNGVNDRRHRWLSVDVNTPDDQVKYQADPVQSWSGAFKVWACATKLDGATLVYAYTPCKLGLVNVTVPGIRNPVPIDLTGRVSRYVRVRPDADALIVEDVTP